MLTALLLSFLPQSASPDFVPSIDLSALASPWSLPPTKRALAEGRPVDLDGYPLDEYRQGELVVRLRPGTEAQAAAFHRALGARVLERVPQGRFERLALPPELATPEALRLYARLPFVELAERNLVRRLSHVPFDPVFNSPKAGQWAVKRLGCQRAWDHTLGSSAVIIAVIDSGVANHDDLAGAFVSGWNTADDDGDTDDTIGHGTDVAVILGANNNHLGTVGVAPGCRIMPIKAFSDDGTTFDTAGGITWAVDHGAHVLQMSWSSPYYSAFEDWALQDAFDEGCVLVAAAGNDGDTTQQFPAALPDVIAVAGTGYLTDARWSDSSHGPWVDVAAPAVLVASTEDETFDPYWLNGTSYSSPLVAGVAGLLFSVLGTGTDPADIRDRIEDHLDPVPGGWAPGRVNAGAALADLNIPTHSSWAAEALLGGTYQLLAGTVEALQSTLGNDVSLDTRSVAGQKLGPLIQYNQTLIVPLDFDVDATGDLSHLTLNLEGRSSTPSLTITVELLNWSTTVYESVGTAVLGTGSDTQVEIKLTSAASAKYLSPGEDVYLRYRALKSSYGMAPPPFTVEMDLVRVTAVYY